MWDSLQFNLDILFLFVFFFFSKSWSINLGFLPFFQSDCDGAKREEMVGLMGSV